MSRRWPWRGPFEKWGFGLKERRYTDDLAITRDPQTGLVTATALGQVSDATTYNDFEEPLTYEADVIGAPLYAVQYHDDVLGRITEKAETLNGESHTYDYAYDVAERLTDVLTDGLPTAHYDYDLHSNRIGGFDQLCLTIGNASIDSQDGLASMDCGSSAATYAYTANGELQNKTDSSGTTTYTYDVLGNLTATALSDGTQIVYAIDGKNRRIGKKVNGTLVQGFLYDGQLHIVAELDGSNNIVSRFVYGSKPNLPDYTVRAGVTYRIIADHLGSPRLVVNVDDGSIAQRMDYDEFGNVTEDTNPGFQPFGFAGGLYDRDTKLVRFGARDYDPRVGRWTTHDPIGFGGGSTNLYGYVLNDPVNGVDSNGLWRNPRDIYNYALRRGQLSGLPGIHNGLQDAYRHCLASCMLTREDTEATSELLGWLNEEFGDICHNQENGERAMDEFNNEQGRQAGQIAQSTQDCENACINAATSGNLKTYTEHSTPGYWYW